MTKRDIVKADNIEPKIGFEAQQPWVNKPQLDANISNRWSSSATAWFKAFSTMRSTGDWVVTWVGFKPSQLEVYATDPWNPNGGWSRWIMWTETNSTGNVIYWWASAVSYFWDAIINLKDGGGTDQIVGKFISFDDDGFTLNLSTALGTQRYMFLVYK